MSAKALARTDAAAAILLLIWAGMVLGFAFLRTGNLLTAILVHGLWNGGIFILLRLAA